MNPVNPVKVAKPGDAMAGELPKSTFLMFAWRFAVRAGVQFTVD
jgi:hypothetical protein